jgi:hypothetical protein
MQMAISTGKAARRKLGTRANAKRHNRKVNPAKQARWAQLEKERKAKGEKHNIYA